MRKHLCAAVAALALIAGITAAQSTLNNDSVAKMVAAGLGEDVIISMIKSQPGNYAVGPEAVIQLKNAGVSDRIISAMVEKGSGGSAPSVGREVAAPSAVPASVDEVGIYFKDKDKKWVQLLPEVVNWKTGGFLKSFATSGIVKGDVNGHIASKSSRNALNSPLDFLIYMADGVAVSEYQLLRLHQSGDSREFRSTTGGVIHSSGGAQRDGVEFQGKKIAPRMYEVLLGQELKPGEYGFLPPGAMGSSNLASAGKIYTFRVIE